VIEGEQAALRSAEKRSDLGSLKGNCGTIWIVLVVERYRLTTFDNVIECPLQVTNLLQRPNTFNLQRLAELAVFHD